MSTFDLQNLSRRLHMLVLFRPLLHNPVLDGLADLLDDESPQPASRIDRYCAWLAALYAAGGNFGAALLALVLESENPVVKLRAAGKAETPEMADCLRGELALFTELAAMPPAQLARLCKQENLPAYASTPVDFEAEYARRLADAPAKGYGIFATYHMFTLGQGATLLPVKNPDPQRLADLTGYENERAQVVLNTKALLSGQPANNILLYGDAGTGKSSTVKAIGNAYATSGLRLIEVHKNQLYQIPQLMDALAQNPLKFILFIDDLSFPAGDSDFTELKAILEGNISARPHNIVVYATSNRRHLLRQHFSDRMGEEIHLNDTLEEQASLSARFGITITFLRPDKELYLSIVQALAKAAGLGLPADELFAKAEAHAIRYGGRSPRTARQFVELQCAAQALGKH